MIKKIFRGSLLIAIATILFSLFLILLSLYRYYGDQFEAQLKNEANLIVAGMQNSGTDYLSSLEEITNRITHIAADGTVLYDNSANASTMENHKDREEVMEALSQGTGYASRQSDTLSMRTLYYAVLLNDGTILRVSTTQYTFWIMFASLLQPMLLSLLVACILAAIMVSRFSQSVIQPINAIDPEHPDIDESYEEIAPLLKRLHRQNERVSKQIQEITKKQREFDLITNHMNEGLLLIDKRTDILSHNNSAMRLLQVPPGEYHSSILTLNRSEPFRNTIMQVLNGKKATCTIQIGERYSHMIASPVYDSHALSHVDELSDLDKSITGAMILLMDVTEKKNMEKLRREFTANVSHELKTPLTSLYGITDMLQNNIVSTEDIPVYIHKVHQIAGHLIDMIQDITKLTELDRMNELPPPENIDLYEIAEKVIYRMQKVADQRDIQLALHGCHASIQGLPSLLEDILYHLCDNSIKYNQPGGYVHISIDKFVPEHGAGEIILSVEDSGIGMEEASMQRIFERFYRIDQSHCKQIEGTGLGLSIVKHAVMYHKGSIEIDSQPGKGTKIQIHFPV